jgi:hypothetical protein
LKKYNQGANNLAWYVNNKFKASYAKGGREFMG